MRVAQVGFVIDPALRGPGEILDAWPDNLEIARSVLEAGATEVLLCLAAGEDARVERGGVRVELVRDPRLMGRPVLPVRQAELLRRFQPDVLHVHGLSWWRQILYLSRRLGNAAILAQDHSNKPERSWRTYAQRLALARVEALSFTAREQRQPFVEAGVISSSLPVFEVVEGSTRFEPGDREEARKRTGIFGEPCLLWVGNLDGNKDPLFVLGAVEQAMIELPGLELWCCYKEAPLLDLVRAKIASSERLRGHVHLLGRKARSELELYHRAADFFVSGSHSEGSGYSMIEALACGTTPLVTDIAPFRRMSGQGQVASLTTPGDVEGMSRALREWAAKDRGTLRRAARSHFEQALSYEAIGRELMAAYRRISGAGEARTFG